MLSDVAESRISFVPVVTAVPVEEKEDVVGKVIDDDRDGCGAPYFRQELIVNGIAENASIITAEAQKGFLGVTKLHSHPVRPLPSLTTPPTTLRQIDESGDDQDASETVVSTTTSTTTATTRSKNGSSTGSSSLTEASCIALPQPQDERRIRPTRKLVVESKHILHLRTQEIQAILQSFPQRQYPSSPPSTEDGDFIATCPDTTKTSLIRDSSNTSSTGITSQDVTSSASASTTPTFLIVTGPTGSGKTKLLEAALKDLVEGKSNHHHINHGYYIRGTFDRLQHPDPYRVFTMALTDFTSQVLARCSDSPGMIISMRQAIRNACGDEVLVLIQMIPLLSVIIADQIPTPLQNTGTSDDFTSARSLLTASAAIDTNPNRPPVQQDEATQRFVFVLQKFLRAICTVVSSIVLVLEDVQYADNCSIDVLCSILTDLHQIPGLLVTTTYNGTDFINDCTKKSSDCTAPSDLNLMQVRQVVSTESASYFVESIRKLEQSHLSDSLINIQAVVIKNFDVEQVQYLLSQTLQQCAHFDLQVDENFLDLVMHQTSGNLYRIIELLNWLEDHQLVTTNCPTIVKNGYTYWTWNIDDINRAVNDEMLRLDESTGLKSNGQPFSTSNVLSNVPLDVIEVVKVGACFGSSRMDETLMKHVLGYPIHKYIAEAVRMGILMYLHDSSDGKQYAFIHENVQSLVYDLIPENDRELFHLEIGRRLLRRIDRDELDRNIFVVLSQIWKGRRLISRSSERFLIAAMCLHAGRKAAKSSSFRISLLYLKFGIELLGDRGWRDEYELTLMLYNATAEMEVCNANYERMELLVAEVLQHSRCVDDTIQARSTQVYAFGVSDRQQEGLTIGVQLLADLGFAFPLHFCVWTMRSEMKTVLSLLKGKSNDYIKRLPIIEDAKVLAAMHVLNMMFLHSLLVRPRLSAFVTLKMMKLTLTYGLCFMSPLAFGTFGMLCVKWFSTPDTALRYGELGLELLDMFQVREYLPRVYAAYYACIFPWKHPLPEALDHLRHAQRIGMQTGDVEFACLCANLWGYVAMDTDLPLDEIQNHWTAFQSTMKSRRQTSILRMSVTCLQAIQYLQGKDVDFTVTEQLLQHSIDNNIPSTINGINWSNAKKAYLFNDLFRADEIAFAASFSKHFQSLPPTCEIVQTAFLNGMISLAMATLQRRDCKARPKRTRKQYIAEGQNMIRFVKKYALWSTINYVDKQFLLEAELAAVEGRQDQAMQYYTCAVAMSKSSRNIFVQGLSNERAGKYCFSVLNQPKIAMTYFTAALQAYGDWKAHRKVDHLQEEIKSMYNDN